MTYSITLTEQPEQVLYGLHQPSGDRTQSSERTAYGWRVGKISMKAKHISFVRENHEGEPL